MFNNTILLKLTIKEKNTLIFLYHRIIAEREIIIKNVGKGGNRLWESGESGIGVTALFFLVSFHFFSVVETCNKSSAFTPCYNLH